jgi:hypothetical protein
MVDLEEVAASIVTGFAGSFETGGCAVRVSDIVFIKNQ